MGIEAEFKSLGAALVNRYWAVSALKEDPRELVVSVWDHNLVDQGGALVYDDSLRRWRGAGRNLLLEHLAVALAEGLPLRMVRATQENRDDVLSGRVKNARNRFKAEPGWVGRVDRLEGDDFRLVFELDGDVESVPAMAPSGAKYWRVAQAVETIGGGTAAEIGAWLQANFPNDTIGDLRANLEHLTVNSTSRPHFDKSRKNWRSNTGHPRDRLFKSPVLGTTNRVRFDPFKPAIHGHVDLQKNSEGKWEAVSITMTEQASVEAEAESQAFVQLPPLDSDHDARVWAMRAVAQRRGQSIFRGQLLEAYRNRCAITGSTADAVLEAAHILPYRGEHTNRVDNGLLLRADIHTLFDLGLVWVADDMRIAIAPSLRGTEYQEMDGRKLGLPELPAHHPNAAHLRAHADRFKTTS